ncbi:general stress protein, partial [Staphylococcus aureus]|nr:general stress protein [Staphylococcus aureus]HEK6440056.1 general stress protein [Staphylococcus aureus]
MADITVVNDTGELYNVINQKKSEGYLESELTIISKSKLHLNDLHDSEISLISTSGTFSDRMTKLLTGEDGEHAVLSRYNLAPDELEKYKQLILDDKMLVVAVRDKSSH